ncbi:MAG: tRNA preQ1(34) S-adenosylmethionine ribosyltransferase-isomerase QueA [Chitinivibrionales bacterium]|nr:tRNA preQ1(34) S-adenosylmethionine ribosyltransferase-isomerase QueA [Chitinivibrionales bacterium]
MKTSDFDYYLPPELIAQYPPSRRGESRLLSLNKGNGQISHKQFSDLPTLLAPGDRLVFNDTKVIPARLFCTKETGARIELLFIEPDASGRWKALAKPLKRLKKGMHLSIEKSPDKGVSIDDILSEGYVSVRAADSNGSLIDIIEHYGDMPLPPYIKRKSEAIDKDRYQTVFAENPGAVAAPTAGLHFTPSIMNILRRNGIDFSFVTLSVGAGTFLPVKDEDPEKHPMHKESYILSDSAAKEIKETHRQGRRVIAVGTTVVRVLEHCSDSLSRGEGSEGETSLMILPGYTFNVVDGLITNFHLPCSTLLMLVSAFASFDFVMKAYKGAVEKGYRFYSYGDAMIVL